MQSGKAETLRHSWWSCLRKEKVTCYEEPGEIVVIQLSEHSLFTKLFWLFLLSGKHVLVRYQKVLFFQALKWNWKWARAGILLVWDNSKTILEFLLRKGLCFSYGRLFFSRMRKILVRKSSLFTRYRVCGLLLVICCFDWFRSTTPWYMALEEEEWPLSSSSPVWRWANARQEKPLPGSSRQWCSQHSDRHPDQFLALQPWMKSRLHLWLRAFGPQFNDLLSNSEWLSIMLDTHLWPWSYLNNHLPVPEK